MDRHELFAAMAHLHHAHATALPIEHLVGCLTQHFFWHGRGAGGEIKDAHREILEARAKKREIAQKTGEVGSLEGNHHEAGHAILTTGLPIIPRRKRKWPFARVRKRPLSHCRRQPAKPRTPYSLPGGGQRDISAAFRPLA
ncbi:MAG TPA: hypothetical protein VEN30_08265 [Paraburkholderia sp.]|nr:hypothetical protein [Paraburkholderia sp.]